MDAANFDKLVRKLAARASRRGAIGGLLTGMLSTLLPEEDAEADRRYRRRPRDDAQTEKKGGGKKGGDKKDGGKKGGGKKGGGKKGGGKGKGGAPALTPPPAPPAAPPVVPPASPPVSPPVLPPVSPPPPPGTCTGPIPLEGCGFVDCSTCFRVTTMEGAKFCASNSCTGVACESTADCLAAFPGSNASLIACQAEGEGCCGRTCVKFCPPSSREHPAATPGICEKQATNNNCLWETGSRSDGLSCSRRVDCCPQANRACENGICCVPDRGVCERDEECCNGQCTLSDDGTSGSCCRELGQTCNGPFACCGDLACSSGGRCCIAPSATCTRSQDCCDGGVCLNGKCCKTRGRECFGGDCCGGSECRNGMCLDPQDPDPSETCLGIGASCIGSTEPCCLNGFCNIAGVCECHAAPTLQCGGIFGSCCQGTCVNGFCR